MKSYQKTYRKLSKKNKKENALDTISKSMFNFLNFNVMSSIKNHVQLIGNLGDDPTVTNLESGKKVARFSLATNENYKGKDGEKKNETNWHTIVAWGKTAEIIEKFATKGDQIGVVGKLKTRSYVDKEGNQKYTTEVVASEILLLNSN